MAIVTRRDFKVNIDMPKSSTDVQKRLLDGALVDRNNVKNTTLSRLHGIKTEVIYYEQIISDRQGNLANTAALNQFDPNILRFRKISNFVILTDELDSQLDKDVFTNLTYEGSAKILPNTLIPNINDYFIMKVFESYHVFRIIEINPVLIEKDSGYEIRYDMYRQDIIPEKFEINDKIKDFYTFDYNHVGTDFRTVLKVDESEFILNSRTLMYDLLKIYSDTFYHRTLNTFMSEIGRFTATINNKLLEILETQRVSMIGNVLLEGRTLYDVSLVNFINKFDLTSTSEYIHYVTEHLKPTRKYYNDSIFSAVEHMDANRFKNTKQMVMYSKSNLFNFTNRLYGRFIVEHIPEITPSGEPYIFNDWTTEPDNNTLSEACNYINVDLFPSGFVYRIKNYDSDSMYSLIDNYENANEIMIDIISTFISEKDMNRKRVIIVKLTSILVEKFINYLYEGDFEYSGDMMYTYPLTIYILKYMTREISSKEYK